MRWYWKREAWGEVETVWRRVKIKLRRAILKMEKREREKCINTNIYSICTDIDTDPDLGTGMKQS